MDSVRATESKTRADSVTVKKSSSANRQDLKEMIRDQLKPMFRFRFFVVVLCILSSLLGLVQPYLIGRLVDNLSRPSHTIYIMGATLIALLLGKLFFNWLQNYFWFKMIHKGIALARSRVFHRLIGANRYGQANSGGDLVNRVVNDTAYYAELLLIIWPVLLLNSITLLVVFGFLFFMSIPMALVILALSVAYFFTYLKLNRRIRSTTKLEREGFSSVMQTAQNMISGMSTIELYNSGAFFAKKFSSVVHQHYRFLVGVQKWKSLGLSSTDFLLSAMPVAAVLSGAYLLLRGDITLGVIFSFFAYLPYLSEPIQNLTDFNLTLQQAKSVEARIAEIVQSADEEHEQALPQLAKLEQISFEQVFFTYEGTTNQVLQNLNLTLRPGERLAITGTSGSGKSTCLKLLLGYLAPVKGELQVNGKPLSYWDKRSYLNRIAVLPQDIFMFDGTIEENVHLGRQFAEAEMHKARAVAHLNVLTDKNSTDISGGERQRVGLTRSLLKHSDLLILDEPTSELDMNTERTVVENLHQYLQQSGTMMIVVSHRPEILKICTSELRLLPNGEWQWSELGIKREAT